MVPLYDYIVEMIDHKHVLIQDTGEHSEPVLWIIVIQISI